MDPQFSIIVPIYNVENYLEKCVNSILEQSYQNYQLILVDDGSTDRSPELCDKFCENNEKISVIHKANGGLSSARNTGLDIAKGEYIIFLDSDDYWDDRDALLKIYNRIQTTHSDIYIFGMKKFFQSTGKYSEERKPIFTESNLSFLVKIRCLMQNNTFVACAWDKVIRRGIIADNTLRFTQGQMSEDIEWCIKLLFCVESIETISECFYVYRQQNKTSITSNIARKNMEDILQVIEKYMSCEKDYVKHFIANQYVLWITTANRISIKEIRDLVQRAKQYWFLLDYDWYPYVKKVKRIKWVGFSGVKALLGFYRRLKY